jgi:hypothetical protein
MTVLQKDHLGTEGTELLNIFSYFLCVLITLWAVAELVFAVDSLIELQYKFFY